jgi:hypothetical protein
MMTLEVGREVDDLLGCSSCGYAQCTPACLVRRDVERMQALRAQEASRLAGIAAAEPGCDCLICAGARANRGARPSEMATVNAHARGDGYARHVWERQPNSYARAVRDKVERDAFAYQARLGLPERSHQAQLNVAQAMVNAGLVTPATMRQLLEEKRDQKIEAEVKMKQGWEVVQRKLPAIPIPSEEDLAEWKTFVR